MQNISTVIDSSIGWAVKPSSDDRWPSWKIQVITPRVAPRLSRLRSSARNGCTTLPVNRKSSRKVLRTTRATASGSLSAMDSLASTSTASFPPTRGAVPGGGVTARTRSTSFSAASDFGVRLLTTLIRCASGRPRAESAGPGTAGRPAL